MLTLARLTIMFSLNQRAEIATSWPELAIGVLEDSGHRERETQEVVRRDLERCSTL